MREIKNHLAEGEKNQLRIEAVSEAYPMGGMHRYDIIGFDTSSNPANVSSDGYKTALTRLVVIFQNGSVQDLGQNGITMEALLAIVADRLTGFQNTPDACDANAHALIHVQSALNELKSRTQKRIADGTKDTRNG
jgi:hypothetical protein